MEWLAPIWDHKDEWPNVTKKYRNVCQLQLEVERNLVDQVRHNLLLCISVPLECGPQAATVACGVAYRFCRGSGSSCSEHEGDGGSHTIVEPPREEWWKSTLQQSATAMPWASRSCGTLEDECEALVCKWFQRPVETVGGAKDFSDTTVLQWWGRYHVRYPEIANLARRRLCAQASSATSERAFSKAGLVLSKKRQRLTADHVDGISLLGWHYKDNGWGESSKRIRCVPQVEGQRQEEESEMVAL